MKDILLHPIGFVKNKVSIRKDVSWGDEISVIQLDDEYRSGLTGLEDFSTI